VTWSDEREIASLAQNLDNAVKVCAEIALRSGMNKTEPGKSESLALKVGLLEYSEPSDDAGVPPPNPKFGARKFGRWLDPHAHVTLVSYEAPVCILYVSNSDWAQETRSELYDLLQVGNFYKPTGAEQSPKGGTRRIFQAETPDEIRFLPTVTVDSFDAEDAKEPQLAVTVAMVSKES
jgi:hypothetical protein